MHVLLHFMSSTFVHNNILRLRHTLGEGEYTIIYIDSLDRPTPHHASTWGVDLGMPAYNLMPKVNFHSGLNLERSYLPAVLLSPT